MRDSRRIRLWIALMSLSVLPIIARADSNSIFLINATNGPIDQYIGTGIRIGEIDVAPGVADGTHAFLLNQILGTTNLTAGTAGGLDSHATQVAGVMVSTDAVVRGVAPGAKVYSIELGGTLPNAAFFLATQQNVRVINASLGTDSVFTNAADGSPLRRFNTLGTSVVERALDRLVSQTGVSYVQASGNEGSRRSVAAGSENGTNTVVQEAGAFNIIVVGSVNNATAGTATNVTFSSSRGYLVDGRSAVSIVAPGGGIIMPTTPTGPNGDRVATNSGTSFAAPHVAATIARLIEAAASNQFPNAPASQAQDPRVIKAALLNSATKLPDWTQGAVLNGSLTGGVTRVTQPLDKSQGAGLLNANGAYLQLAAGRWAPRYVNDIDTGNLAALTGWDFANVKLSMTNVYQLTSQAAGTVSITLDWYRDVGATVAGTNSVNGLANLDLYLFSSGDAAFSVLTNLAMSVSSVDNLEHLYFTNLPAAYYEFGVNYANYNAAPGGTNLTLVTYGVAWSFTAVPEPSTLLLAALGMSVVWRLRRRRT